MRRTSAIALAAALLLATLTLSTAALAQSGAAATPRGLIVPNVKDAQELSLRELDGLFLRGR